MCVVAGTGSLVCSRAGRGVVKSGGKGYLLGDEGSAFAYGRDALRYFLNHPRDASSALRKAVAEVFGTEDEGEIVSSVYRAPTPAPLLARLAKAVGADATAGEEYALRLADWHGGQLAEITLAHIARHLPGADAVSVCLAGGLWKASAAFRDTFAGRLAEGLGRRELVVSRIARPPLHGAVELAREMEFGNRK